MKIDEQLKHLFPDPEDAWYWRLCRVRDKEPAHNWMEADGALVRNICKEIQSLMWEREFSEWDKEHSINELHSNKDLSLVKEYEMVCSINENKQRINYITDSLNKICAVINDNIYMHFPEDLTPETDMEGHIYIHQKERDDD